MSGILIDDTIATTSDIYAELKRGESIMFEVEQTIKKIETLLESNPNHSDFEFLTELLVTLKEKVNVKSK